MRALLTILVILMVLPVAVFASSYSCTIEDYSGTHTVTAKSDGYHDATIRHSAPGIAYLFLTKKPEDIRVNGKTVNQAREPLSDMPIEVFRTYFLGSTEHKTFSASDGGYEITLKPEEIRGGFGLQAKVAFHPDHSEEPLIKFVDDRTGADMVYKEWMGAPYGTSVTRDLLIRSENGGTGYAVLQKMHSMFKDEVDLTSVTIHMNSEKCKSACQNGLDIYISKDFYWEDSFYPHEYAHTMPHRGLKLSHHHKNPLEESWANFISTWVRDSEYYAGGHIASYRINRTEYDEGDYLSIEWSLTGVLWDINKKYPGSVWEVTKSGSMLNTIEELYFELKASPTIKDKTDLCEIFKKHGFDFKDMDVSSWDSDCK